MCLSAAGEEVLAAADPWCAENNNMWRSNTDVLQCWPRTMMEAESVATQGTISKPGSMQLSLLLKEKVRPEEALAVFRWFPLFLLSVVVLLDTFALSLMCFDVPFSCSLRPVFPSFSAIFNRKMHKLPLFRAF